MEYIIDRIERLFSICESNDRKIVKIKLFVLPENIKERDVILKKWCLSNQYIKKFSSKGVYL